MPKSSSFEVISLGKSPVVDTCENNTVILEENGEKLLGSYGSADNPLSNNIHLLDPGSIGYDANNSSSNDKLSIDGGPEQTHDASTL